MITPASNVPFLTVESSAQRNDIGCGEAYGQHGAGFGCAVTMFGGARGDGMGCGLDNRADGDGIGTGYHDGDGFAYGYALGHDGRLGA